MFPNYFLSVNIVQFGKLSSWVLSNLRLIGRGGEALMKLFSPCKVIYLPIYLAIKTFIRIGELNGIDLFIESWSVFPFDPQALSHVLEAEIVYCSTSTLAIKQKSKDKHACLPSLKLPHKLIKERLLPATKSEEKGKRGSHHD